MKAEEIIGNNQVRDVDCWDKIDWRYYWLRPLQFYKDYQTKTFKMTYWIRLDEKEWIQMENKAEQTEAHEWHLHNCFVEFV